MDTTEKRNQLNKQQPSLQTQSSNTNIQSASVIVNKSTTQINQTNSSRSDSQRQQLLESKETESIFDQLEDSNDEIIYKKIRCIGEVKTYLEHFIPPDLSISTAVTSFFIAPFSILLNMYFIVSNFINLFIHPQQNEKYYLKIGNSIVVYVEFIGICILLIGIIISFKFKYKCVGIDFINKCGSWSSFQLFYNFRPKNLMNYYTIIFSHHKSRLNQTNIAKYEKCNAISRKLDKEISSNINNSEINQKMLKARQTSLKILLHFLKSKDYGMNSIYTESMTTKLIRNASYVTFVVISLILLLFGMTSLLLKLSQFGYINKEEITEWTLEQYIAFIAFCNQLWNMCDIDAIKIDTMYRFIFMEQKGKYTRFIANKIAMYDSIIKTQLMETFGLKGLLLAISINSNFIHKIIIQDSFDMFSVSDLITYKHKKTHIQIDDYIDHDKLGEQLRKLHKYKDNMVKPLLSKDIIGIKQTTQNKKITLDDIDNTKKHEGKMTNIKAAINDYTQWIKSKINIVISKLTMQYYQQPIHPLIEAETMILRFRQKYNSNKDYILYGKQHKDNRWNIKYNIYSANTKQIYDTEISVKTNIFMHVAMIFEKIETLIKWIVPSLIVSTFLATWILSLKVVNNQHDDWTLDYMGSRQVLDNGVYIVKYFDQHCFGKSYFDLAEGYMMYGFIFIGIWLIFVCCCCKKYNLCKLNIDTLQSINWLVAFAFSCEFLMVIFWNSDAWKLFICFNENKLDSISAIIQWGQIPNYFYHFLIANQCYMCVMLLILLIFAASYPLLFVIILLYVVTSYAMGLLMIMTPIFDAGELAVLYYLLFGEYEVTYNALTVISMILFVLKIWMLVYTFIQYCATYKYRNNNLKYKLKIGFVNKIDIIGLITRILIYIMHISYLITWYTVYGNGLNIVTSYWEFYVLEWVAWEYVVFVTAVGVYISVKRNNPLNYIYHLNWLRFWKEEICCCC
eukprot:519320_1